MAQAKHQKSDMTSPKKDPSPWSQEGLVLVYLIVLTLVALGLTQILN